MLLALALASVPMTAVDAERAFAAAAQAQGQWTAFRAFAAPDATMFAPQPVNAQAFLKERRDPPRAIDWWPTASFVACDGRFAVNTGGWRRPDGGVGYFSTVWIRQSDGGWKWIVDGGDGLQATRPRVTTPKVERASCRGRPAVFPALIGAITGGGRSADGTLGWAWAVASDGARTFRAAIWTGNRWRTVIDDHIAGG